MSGFLMPFLQHLSVTCVPINMTVLVIWSLQIFWFAELLQNTSDFNNNVDSNFVFIDSKEICILTEELSTRENKNRQFPKKMYICFSLRYCATTIFRGDDGNQAALRYYVTAVRGSGKSLHYLFVTRTVIPASRGGAEEGENAFLSSPLSLPPSPPGWWGASKWSCSVYRDCVLLQLNNTCSAPPLSPSLPSLTRGFHAYNYVTEPSLDLPQFT